MSRLGRLSLSPDPSSGLRSSATPPLLGAPPVYKSGLILQQQERNSPSYQSYKQKNHDYVNTDYILHTGNKVLKLAQGKVLPREKFYLEKKSTPEKVYP